MVTVAVVAAAYLAGKLIYRLRDIVLIIVVAGFLAVLLNPMVVFLQKKAALRRGLAVTIVSLLAALAFLALALAFGYPLVSAVNHLADRLPSYVSSAESGKGWIGHIARRYHILTWVQRNTPKLVSYAQSLSKPALNIGKGAVTLVIELFTIFVLVLLLLLEGPKMRRWTLSQMAPQRAATVTRVAGEVNSSVVGYMLGNLLTSLIAGVVVLVTLMIVGVPFPLLWGLWVALVDFLPMIGGALAGIPTVLFAFFHGVTAGVVTLVVFLVYTQVENHILNPVVMSQDGADQPAAGADRGAGRRLARQPDRRGVRRFRRRPAGHPGGRHPAGAGPRGVAGHGPQGSRPRPPSPARRKTPRIQQLGSSPSCRRQGSMAVNPKP